MARSHWTPRICQRSGNRTGKVVTRCAQIKLDLFKDAAGTCARAGRTITYGTAGPTVHVSVRCTDFPTHSVRSQAEDRCQDHGRPSLHDQAAC